MLQCDFQYQKNDFLLDVNFVMESQLLGLIGASGSGKSTLLKNIVGALAPNEGSIVFQNQILFDQQQQINLAMYQRRIALIFQQSMLFPHLNVRQNLKYARNWGFKRKEKFSFEQVVELLELHLLLTRKAHQLSGGEAQRVSIGRALLSSPHLLLLDEPLTGLDQRLKQQILHFLKKIKQQTYLPMIYVTHHPEEIDFLEGELIEMHNGKINSKI